MLKTFLSAAGALALLGVSANAANVAIANNAPPFPIGSAADASGIAGGAGFVLVGSFSISDAAIQAAFGSADTAALDTAFTQFGGAVDFATPSANNLPGLFNADVASPILAGNSLIGQDIYIVAGEGTGIGDATSLAILHSSTAFEQDNPVFGTSVDVPGSTVVIGTVGQVAVPVGGQVLMADGVIADPVPEPSAFALVGLGLAGFILRRRR